MQVLLITFYFSHLNAHTKSPSPMKKRRLIIPRYATNSSKLNYAADIKDVLIFTVSSQQWYMNFGDEIFGECEWNRFETIEHTTVKSCWHYSHVDL